MCVWPQRGCSGVPFMNSMTGAAFMSCCKRTSRGCREWFHQELEQLTHWFRWFLFHYGRKSWWYHWRVLGCFLSYFRYMSTINTIHNLFTLIIYYNLWLLTHAYMYWINPHNIYKRLSQNKCKGSAYKVIKPLCKMQNILIYMFGQKSYIGNKHPGFYMDKYKYGTYIHTIISANSSIRINT